MHYAHVGDDRVVPTVGKHESQKLCISTPWPQFACSKRRDSWISRMTGNPHLRASHEFFFDSSKKAEKKKKKGHANMHYGLFEETNP